MILDDLRRRLDTTFSAGPGAFSLAISGTGTAGMEAAVANITSPGTRVLVVVTGYFGDRLAQIFERYGATVTRVDVEWGRACDPAAVERALAAAPADIVAVVHAETSTGVLNPVQAIAQIAARASALTVVDAVTSFAAMPLETGAWGIDICYSCSQKGLGAPSGMAPLSFSARALAKKVPSRSFYLDLALLEDYWVRRKYHHTISAPLVYAVREALMVVEEEGRERALGASRTQSPCARRGARGARPVAAAAGRRTSLDVECGQGAGGRRRGGGAPPAARRVQHRDRCRPRAARRAHLESRLDGRGLDTRERAALPHRARTRAVGVGLQGLVCDRCRHGCRGGGARIESVARHRRRRVGKNCAPEPRPADL